MYMGFIVLRNLAAQLVASPESIDVPRNSIERTKSELESFRTPMSETYHATGADERSSFLKATGWVMLTTSTAYLYKDRMETLGGAFGRQSCRFRPGSVHRATHIVGPAAAWCTTERLKRSGQAKLALSRRIALMAAYSYATIHNLRQVGTIPGSIL